jgi:WD40 repeat protein
MNLRIISPQGRRAAERERRLTGFPAPLRLCGLLFAFAISATPGAEAPSSKSIPIARVKHSGDVDFEKEILPILKNNCLACHNQTKPKGGLVLETPQTILKGGDTGPAVVRKKPAESLLLKAASHQDPELIMPPPDNKVAAMPLKPEELGLISVWIGQGAKGEVQASAPIFWQPIPPGLNTIYALALARDGQFVACGRANQIFVYHLPSARLVARLIDPQLQKSSNAGAAHRDTVNSLMFSPDGELLASGGYREVKLWRRDKAADGSLSGTNLLARNPDWLSARIANKQLFVFDTNGAVVRSNAFPKTFAELKGDNRMLFRIAEGEREVAFAKSEIEFRENALKSAETNQGTIIARRNRAADTNAALANVAGQKANALTNAMEAQREAAAAVEELGPDVAKAVRAFFTAEKEFTNATAQLKTAEGDKAKVEHWSGEVRLTSNALATAKTALEALPAETKAKQKLTTEKLLAAKKSVADAEKGFNKADEARRIAEHELKLAESALRKEEAIITTARAALAGAEDELAHVAAHLQRVKKEFGEGKPATALAYSPDDRALVTADESGMVHFWSADSGAPFDPAWKANWTLARTIGTGNGSSSLSDRVNALCFTPDGEQLVTGGGEPTRGGEVKAWRTRDGVLLRDFPNIHSDSVFALGISADGKLLASGAADRFAKIVDFSTARVLKTFEGHTHHVLGVALKRDARTLLTAGADNVAKSWDVTTGERRKNIEGFAKEVTAAAFVGIEDQAVLGAGDGQVVLVKSSGERIRSFSGANDYVNAVAVAPDGSIIVAGGADGVLRVWDGKSGKLLNELRGL